MAQDNDLSNLKARLGLDKSEQSDTEGGDEEGAPANQQEGQPQQGQAQQGQPRQGQPQQGQPQQAGQPAQGQSARQSPQSQSGQQPQQRGGQPHQSQSGQPHQSQSGQPHQSQSGQQNKKGKSVSHSSPTRVGPPPGEQFPPGQAGEQQLQAGGEPGGAMDSQSDPASGSVDRIGSGSRWRPRFGRTSGWRPPWWRPPRWRPLLLESTFLLERRIGPNRRDLHLLEFPGPLRDRTRW